MIWPIWKKSFRDAFWLLSGCTLVMFGFFWLFVYMTSLVPSSAFLEFVSQLPDETHGLFGISVRQAADWPGRLSLSFVDPTVVLVSAIWAIARGSDAVSGPLDRGTLEMLLAQPVSRLHLLVAHNVVTIVGAILMSVAAWMGLAAGIATVHVEQTSLFWFTKVVPLSDLVRPGDYSLSAVNLFALTVFSAALTTLVSAGGRYRRLTIGIIGGFYVVQVILKVAGLAASELDWLFYTTFLGAYWPQVIAVEAMQAPPNDVWWLSLKYNGLLLGGAAVCYLAAAVVFHRRDIPAPL
ncbi:MAG: ABC transporter permease subunit [Planctomycetales bacterium]|nr:ABC transporter permease subunit [Planctomycetales bacterium]NIM10069.1 ABC transporter permease subunit [Planctomycetales bacterium]NIN09510.1 ABC transporter permease subunit [Planctomycetales bacterium]NIN78621.1 ABC transporter permease subunit [Planctomycetales bacterium]NIO35815.1 ABC transporter permease subunit [Planctomycetales bacterium]